MSNEILQPQMRCAFCGTGQPVHLWRVFGELQLLACEPCARPRGLLKRAERDEAGEAPICECCGQPGGQCQHCGARHMPRVNGGCEACHH